jgi:hypothetical protein
MCQKTSIKRLKYSPALLMTRYVYALRLYQKLVRTPFFAAKKPQHKNPVYT